MASHHPLVNLEAIQHRLNNDDHMRGQFLRNPVETLEKLGLKVPETSRNALAKVVKDMQAHPERVPGSTLLPQGPQRDVGIGISISKDF